MVIGSSQQEAEDKAQALQEMIHPDVGRFRLGTDLEADLSDLPLDEPIPESRLPKSANLHKAFFDGIMKIIREENPTLRQLYLRYERGRKTHQGHADAHRRRDGAMGHHGRDGRLHDAVRATLPGGLQDFVKLVVPELQRRGLFRTEYAGTLPPAISDWRGPANPHTALAPRTLPSNPTRRPLHRTRRDPLCRRAVERLAVGCGQDPIRQARADFWTKAERAVPVESCDRPPPDWRRAPTGRTAGTSGDGRH